MHALPNDYVAVNFSPHLQKIVVLRKDLLPTLPVFLFRFEPLALKDDLLVSHGIVIDKVFYEHDVCNGTSNDHKSHKHAKSELQKLNRSRNLDISTLL